jgi:hypothetical protein
LIHKIGLNANDFPLLEHISVIAIQKTFNNINGIEAILGKANQKRR